MSIPFIDLKRQYSALETDIREAIDTVLKHSQFLLGPEVTRLEEEMAQYIGVKNVIGCSSGTDGLLACLMSQDVGPGDAIFTSPFTFIATAEVISFLGATPVFVDIDPRTFNLDPEKLNEAVGRVSREGRLRPRAVIPVDLFGLPADYDPIMDIAGKDDLFVLEDAAQAIGGTYHGRKAGNLGHAAATSFYPTKPLSCYGDGGAIFTNDDQLAEKIRSILVHGQGKHKYDHVRTGITGRLDTIQAAILLVKLTVYPKELERRQRVVEQYNRGLKDLVEIPLIPAGLTSSWALYSILCDRRDDLQKDLALSLIHI